MRLRESGGQITVLVTLHSSLCPGCRAYLDTLAPLAGEFDAWDGRLLVLVPGTIAEAKRLRLPYGKALADEREHLASAAFASVTVADRYGQVFHAARAGVAHDLPAVRDLAEWLKFLGTLCPE